MLDSIVDGYLVVVDSIAERIDALEDELRGGVHESQLERIFDLRREILYLRKTIYPVRDMLSKAAVEGGVFQNNTQIYVRDLNDHLTQVTDAISSSAEMCRVLIDTYHSMMNQKMNAIMKTLTMISTIFLPLNFIAGVYGMNFKHMPELEWRWGYPAVLGAMALVTTGMLVAFIRRRWLFDSRPREGLR
jgi:magnesium transporter